MTWAPASQTTCTRRMSTTRTASARCSGCTTRAPSQVSQLLQTNAQNIALKANNQGDHQGAAQQRTAAVDQGSSVGIGTADML